MMNNRQSNPQQFEDERTRKARRRRSARNVERALAFEAAMFDYRSRHLILILTLGYKPEYRAAMTPNDLALHRDIMFNNARSNELLRDMECIWKIEEGETAGGLHMHLVAFYDGTRRGDVYYAEQIGEYWEHVVTRGVGSYWNSNADKARNEQGPWGDVTGQINREDEAKRQALRLYLEHYIAKDDQQLSSCTNPHYRRFGTSQFPV